MLGLLGFYDELDDGSGRPNGSIRDAVRPVGEPDEVDLVAYLDSGHVLLDVMESGRDVITGSAHRHSPGCSSLRTDGNHQVVCSGNRLPEHGEGVALNPMIYPGSPYTMVVRYQPRQLHEAEVREMRGQFTDVLSSVVEDPELPR